MACSITITSVVGLLDANGNLDRIRVSGTKEDCDYIRVTGCGDSVTRPSGAGTGAWGPIDLQNLAGCQCNTLVTIDAQCISDVENGPVCDDDSWSGTLECC